MQADFYGKLTVTGLVGAVIFGAGWLVWFFTVVPVYEGRMYVTSRNWSRTINYIHRWQTEDCDWEDEDDDGDTEWVCETDTHYETLRTWQRTGEGKTKAYWPEHPPLDQNWNYYFEHHEVYRLNFRSNELNSTFVWTIYNQEVYDQFPLETVATIKLNRMDKIVGVEK